MTYAVGQPIAAADYMGFRGASAPNTAYTNSTSATDAVAALVGVGYGSRGYGQTSVVIPAVTAGTTVITAAQWNYLYAAIGILNTQTGLSLTLPSNVTAGTSVIQADTGTGGRPNLPSIISTLDNNRLVAAISQMAVSSEVSSVLSTAWATSITHEFTQTFSTEDQARYFYNTGGKIYVSASRVGGTGSEVDYAISDMLSQMGTIKIGAKTTTYTGSGGTAYPIGYYGLTSTFQPLFTHTGSAYGYTSVSYTLQARAENIVGVNGGNGTVIRVEAIIATGLLSYNTVDGTITSTVQQLAADVLTITLPTYVTTIPFSSVPIPPVVTNSMFVANNPALSGTGNNNVSKITPAPVLSQNWGTVAGFDPVRVVVTDASGNVYAADDFGNLTKLNSSGNVLWQKSLGFFAGGIAFDSVGNLYVSNEDTGVTNTIAKVTPGGSVTAAWATLALNSEPTGIVIDSADNVYTANYGLRTISKITSAGAVTQTFATLTSQPYGMTIDSVGNLYTSNINGNTVSKITPSGVVTNTYASIAGLEPRGITIDSLDNLYVTAGNNTIVKINTSTNTVTQPWCNTLPTGSNPFALTVDAGNNVYSANTGTSTVSKINTSGTVTNTYALAAGASPESITIDGSGNIYTGNNGDVYGSISKIYSGTVTQNWAILNLAGSVAAKLDSSQNVYVLTGDGTVLKFTSSGGLPAYIYNPDNYFPYASAMAIDTSNNLYIPSDISSVLSVVKINTSTNVVTRGWASVPGVAEASNGIVVDSSNNVYITDAGNSKVYKFSSSGGTPAATYILASGAYPNNIAIDSSGNLYTANFDNNTVSKIVPSTSTVTAAWATTGNQPVAITVDSLGNVFTANGNNTVSQISSAGGSPTHTYTLTSGSTPLGISVDAENNVYTANSGNSTISKIVPSTTTLTAAWATLAAGSNPTALAIGF